MDKKLVIAVSADEEYAIPMCVCLYSLLENLDKKTQCDINIFVPGVFSDESRDLAKTITSKYDNCNLTIHDMSDAYGKAPIREGLHVTTPAYYRLNLASRLPGVDKCLYLDTDTVINADITELYQTDMEGYYIAGIKAAAYYRAPGEYNMHIARLGIINIDTYINTGVAIFNLKAIREDNMEKTFLDLIGRYTATVDQDILNVACYGKIKILPFRFNVMTKYSVSDISSYEKNTRLMACYSKEEWEEGVTNPVIIHYADKVKPWKNLGTVFSEIWWDYFYRCIDDESVHHKYINLAIDSALKIAAETRDQSHHIQELEKSVADLQKSMQEREDQIFDLEEKIMVVNKSKSLRIGLLVTWLPRKVKTFFNERPK